MLRISHYLRALAREPEALQAYLTELDAARGMDRAFDSALGTLKDTLARGPEEPGARRLVDQRESHGSCILASARGRSVTGLSERLGFVRRLGSCASGP